MALRAVFRHPLGVELDSRVRNRSCATARWLAVDALDGGQIALAVAKLTLFVPSTGAVFRSVQRPIRLLDEPHDSTRPSSVRYPSDAAPAKPGTDVLLLGTAHPPPGSGGSATSVEAGVRIATARGLVDKHVRISGPRVWYRTALGGVAPGPAAPLEPTPIVWEHAYGGIDASDATDVRVETRNPVGFGVARERAALVGRPAPRIEDPEAPLDSGSPRPGGLGPIASHWSPRAELAGTFDEAWRRTRAPLWPADADPRCFSCAAPGLWIDPPLAGGEAIEIRGMTPEGLWRFALPRYGVRFRAEVRGVAIERVPHLDTLLVDADVRQVELVWRAAFPAPRRAADLGPLEITDEGLLPPGALDPDPAAIREALRRSPHA